MKRIIFLSAALAASISALGEVFEVKPETRYMLTYDWSVDGQCRDFADDPEGRSKIYDYRGDEYACETLYFGGTSINICTWSGHTSASSIFTPFHLHNVLNIAPISCLFSP
jgi:hypothetical protein